MNWRASLCFRHEHDFGQRPEEETGEAVAQVSQQGRLGHHFQRPAGRRVAAHRGGVCGLLRSVHALQAQTALQQAAVGNGTSGFSMSDIDAEIAAARRARRQK